MTRADVRPTEIHVTCPICREQVDARLDVDGRGYLQDHVVVHKAWSAPHANGFRSGVTITVLCPGAHATVEIDASLDLRLA